MVNFFDKDFLNHGNARCMVNNITESAKLEELHNKCQKS
jgi:hypothetical protein